MTEPVELPSALAIEDFWSWFADQAPSLAANSFADLNQREFGERVKALHPGLVWEVGPGVRLPNAFVVSPGGRKALLEVTELVASLAPEIDGWEIHDAKPPKQWVERVIRLRNPDSSWVEVDLDRWCYALVAWNDHAFFDVTLIAPTEPVLEEQQRLHAAWQLLDGELGERQVIELIGDVKVVTADAWDPNQPCGEASVLREHVAALRARRSAD